MAKGCFWDLSQQHFMASSTLNPGFLMLIGSGWITVCLDQAVAKGMFTSICNKGKEGELNIHLMLT